MIFRWPTGKNIDDRPILVGGIFQDLVAKMMHPREGKAWMRQNKGRIEPAAKVSVVRNRRTKLFLMRNWQTFRLIVAFLCEIDGQNSPRTKPPSRLWRAALHHVCYDYGVGGNPEQALGWKSPAADRSERLHHSGGQFLNVSFVMTALS